MERECISACAANTFTHDNIMTDHKDDECVNLHNFLFNINTTSAD